jgi:ATP-dependent DNA helicase RecG
MVVEHAERFGLSQLHLLRGRVGRGTARSYCVLLVGEEGAGGLARERLAILERTSDGFAIAERDLELRGPGAVFGTWQHGLSVLQFLAEALRHPGLLEDARSDAWGLVRSGPAGEAQAREVLARLAGVWRQRLALAEVG